MTLKKIKLGDYICQYSKVCGIPNLSNEDVSGVNRDKEFFEPSQQVGSDTSKYKIVPPKHYACNLMHVGRDKVLPIALNHTDKNKIVSPAYFVFSFMDNEDILTEYFFILLKCNERDRYFWFHTDGSVRDGMSWDELCDVELEVPSIDIQRKYVAIYKSMVANQKAYEMGLEDLKLTCDAYIDQNKRLNKTLLGSLLTRRFEKNTGFHVKKLVGVGKDGFIEPKQSKDETNGHICYLIKNGDFVFAPPQLHQGSIDYYLGDTTIKCSDAYIVFYINDKTILDPGFLFMVLKNPTIQHYFWYMRDGVREQFDFEQLKEIAILLPPIEQQRAIARCYLSYVKRKQINEQLKNQIKDICPILIKGSIEEAKKAVS